MASHAPMRLAVLIDTENVTPAAANDLFQAIGKLGMATVRRAYGNWSSPAVGGWKSAAHQHALQPVHRHSCTPAKNTTDIALIIDAMDLLHGGRVDGFRLIASDGDYSQLAIRIREQGPVFGFGVSPPHPALMTACMQFTRLVLSHGEPAPAPRPSDPPRAMQEAPHPAPSPFLKSLPDVTPLLASEDLRPLLTQAVRDAAQDNGWALLATAWLGRAQAPSRFQREGPWLLKARQAGVAAGLPGGPAARSRWRHAGATQAGHRLAAQFLSNRETRSKINGLSCRKAACLQIYPQILGTSTCERIPFTGGCMVRRTRFNGTVFGADKPARPLTTRGLKAWQHVERMDHARLAGTGRADDGPQGDAGHLPQKKKSPAGVGQKVPSTAGTEQAIFASASCRLPRSAKAVAAWPRRLTQLVAASR